MAKIRLGPTVIGIRGTIGGITFTANKSGPYATAWTRGANPRLPLQAAQRGRLASIPELWRALTPAEQTDWDTFAALPAQDQIDRLGETFSLSGFGFFTKCNVRLLAIGRSTITATPVIARPAAPTISGLQLPYLDAQTAKITYPSGEFPAGTDQIIEISQAISTGRQVSPTASKTLLETQSPPDTESAFIVPYLDRFGPGQETLKGFTRVYRQTTEGLRSSPGTASFVSSDSPPYAVSANDYNGTTNYALRGADLTGNANSKILLLSLWFRVDAGDGTSRILLDNTSGFYRIALHTTNRILIFLFNPAGTLLLNLQSDTVFLAGPDWHNFIISLDLGTGAVQTAVDGVLETPAIALGPVDDFIDWTRLDHAVGATTLGATPFDGCLAEIYFNNVTRIDLSAPNAIANFVSPQGSPMDLGPLGDFPTNSQPIIYMPKADPSVNLGSGGNFVNQAALSVCSTNP